MWEALAMRYNGCRELLWIQRTHIQHSWPPNAIHFICRDISYTSTLCYYTNYIADRLHCRDEKHNGIICNQETVKVVPFLKNDGDVLVGNAARYYEYV